MASGTRELTRRIKSIKNTRKVTKAMEMVAASKMRKAVKSVLATRDYANLAWATILNLAGKTGSEAHPLLQKRPATKRAALIIIGSNRGLCGGFNVQLVKKAVDSIKKHAKSVEQTDVLSFGTKGRDAIRSCGFNIAADFAKKDITQKSSDVTPIAHLIMKEFLSKKYDKIFVAYTDFISTMKQTPRVKQLLPIVAEQDEYLGVVGKSAGIGATKKFIEEKAEKYLKKGEYSYEYLFEPSPKEVLDEMLPRLVEMQIYQAVLESEASEHSSRMVAMKSASEAAGDMVDELTLYFNRARQSGITQEIAEISAAAAAM